MKTLQQALTELLSDDQQVSKFEARVLREMILADGKVSDEERRFLSRALEENQFDDEAYKLLSETLMRAKSEKRGLFGLF